MMYYPLSIYFFLPLFSLRLEGASPTYAGAYVLKRSFAIFSIMPSLLLVIHSTSFAEHRGAPNRRKYVDSKVLRTMSINLKRRKLFLFMSKMIFVQSGLLIIIFLCNHLDICINILYYQIQH